MPRLLPESGGGLPMLVPHFNRLTKKLSDVHLLAPRPAWYFFQSTYTISELNIRFLLYILIV